MLLQCLYLLLSVHVCRSKLVAFRNTTVKLVYKDHPKDQQNMVLIHGWSLYAGSIAWKVYPWGPVKCGLYKQVVLYTGGL